MEEGRTLLRRKLIHCILSYQVLYFLYRPREVGLFELVSWRRRRRRSQEISCLPNFTWEDSRLQLHNAFRLEDEYFLLNVLSDIPSSEEMETVLDVWLWRRQTPGYIQLVLSSFVKCQHIVVPPCHRQNVHHTLLPTTHLCPLDSNRPLSWDMLENKLWWEGKLEYRSSGIHFLNSLF